MIPVVGSGQEALADLEDRKYALAALNAGLAVSDLALLKALVVGLAKGGLKTGGEFAWRTKSWPKDRVEREKVQGAREWLGERGFLKTGQPGHHWIFEQKTSVPDWIKNQPPFITAMKDAVEHGRVHGPYTVNGVKLPRFNALERFWYGTPPWVKSAYVSSAGHSGAAAGRAGADQEVLSRRPQ